MPPIIPPSTPPDDDDDSGGGIDGGGGGGGLAMATEGVAWTVMPRAAEAVAAEARLEESDVCTAAAVVEAGTAMVAVMMTDAAVMATV